MTRRRPRPIEWWLGHSWVDWLIGPAVAAAILIIDTGHPAQFLSDMARSDRIDVYQSLAGVAGSLLGFFIATVSILLGLMDSTKERMQKALAGENRRRVQSFFFAGITAAAIALVLFLVSILIDDDATIAPIHEISVIGMIFIAGLGTGRIVWVLRKVVQMASMD